ncbi:hypothetical protein EJB05_53681, partial [Eragrostis curvula]
LLFYCSAVAARAGRWILIECAYAPPRLWPPLPDSSSAQSSIPNPLTCDSHLSDHRSTPARRQRIRRSSISDAPYLSPASDYTQPTLFSRQRPQPSQNGLDWFHSTATAASSGPSICCLPLQCLGNTVLLNLAWSVASLPNPPAHSSSAVRPIAMSASSSGSGLHTSHELSLPRTSLQSDDLSLDTKSSCHDGSFPTSFHSASKRSVRRHLLPHSTDLSQGGLPATPSEKKRMAPSSSDCFPTEFHLPTLRQVRRRICTDPAEPHRVNSNLPAKRRPKQPILENTDAFPTDFQFSSRRHAQPRRLQKSSEYLQPQTSFDTQSWQEHKSQLVAASGANASAVSTFAH